MISWSLKKSTYLMATYIVPRNYKTLYLAIVQKLLEFFIISSSIESLSRCPRTSTFESRSSLTILGFDY
jgi:hypothetical protein